MKRRKITIDGKTKLRPRKELIWFGGLQEQVLIKNDNKKTHWRLISTKDLLDHLYLEVIELMRALKTKARGYDRQAQIMKECADVSLMAMMIADKERYDK